MADAATNTLDTTEDTLLGGRVKLSQPRSGYRVAIDPVLLAASVEAAPGERILDVGAGVGAIGLCLVARLGDVFVQGVEVQSELVALAAHNAQHNGWLDFMSTAQHDIESSTIAPYVAERLLPESYDQVVTNPPYLPAHSANRPLDRMRALATVESTANLADWLQFALNRLKHGGTLTMVHRADRLDEILALLKGRAGETVIFPLWPGPGKDANRVIVRTRKGSDAPLRLASGLLLHDGGEKYTATAERILREAGALAF
jgi:tRNA1(Val) A37 N6-methylase TrmN6